VLNADFRHPFMQRPSFPAIIAHRGASEDAPENTLDAFRLAWQQGADAIEMDLRTTSDGCIVALHDANLRRVAGDPRWVSQMKWDELKGLPASRGTNWRGTEVGVPLLEAVLAEVPQGKQVFLDIKESLGMLPALRRVIEAGSLVGSQITILCRDSGVLTEAKRKMPAVNAAWIVRYPSVLGFERLIGNAVKQNLDALDISISWPLDEHRVTRAHDEGLKVFVWTVDDIEQARRFAKVGVDGITTNAPLRMRRLFSA
jgi:glycerophosphoryl diester phosphodiesterase